MKAEKATLATLATTYYSMQRKKSCRRIETCTSAVMEMERKRINSGDLKYPVGKHRRIRVRIGLSQVRAAGERMASFVSASLVCTRRWSAWSTASSANRKCGIVIESNAARCQISLPQGALARGSTCKGRGKTQLTLMRVINKEEFTCIFSNTCQRNISNFQADATFISSTADAHVSVHLRVFFGSMLQYIVASVALSASMLASPFLTTHHTMPAFSSRLHYKTYFSFIACTSCSCKEGTFIVPRGTFSPFPEQRSIYIYIPVATLSYKTTFFPSFPPPASFDAVPGCPPVLAPRRPLLSTGVRGAARSPR